MLKYHVDRVAIENGPNVATVKLQLAWHLSAEAAPQLPTAPHRVTLTGPAALGTWLAEVDAEGRSHVYEVLVRRVAP